MGFPAQHGLAFSSFSVVELGMALRSRGAIQSALQFRRIFSMGRIRDVTSVPQHLLDKMAGIVWDNWFGDDNDGAQSSQFACMYLDDATFYFRFERAKTKSSAEAINILGLKPFSIGNSLNFPSPVSLALNRLGRHRVRLFGGR